MSTVRHSRVAGPPARLSWWRSRLGVVGIAGVVASIGAATALGSVSIPLDTTIRLLSKTLLHLDVGGDERAQAAILYLIRLPRVLTAALVGACLALSGAVMQGLFRNPLADAGLIGVSSGGALAGALVISAGLAVGSSVILPLATFGGALASAFAVYFFATRRGRTSLTHLLLVGVAVNALLGSLTTGVLTMAQDYEVSRQLLFWLMGGLDGRGWSHVQMMLPFAVAGAVPVLLFGRDLNAMLLGEDTATSLGIPVEATKCLLLALSALLAGAAVAVSGTIGFVGLVIPHIVRLLVGPDHRWLLPGSIMVGAIFLVWCDVLARTLVPSEELRLGVVTAIVGAPFFLNLLLRQERSQRGVV